MVYPLLLCQLEIKEVRFQVKGFFFLPDMWFSMWESPTAKRKTAEHNLNVTGPNLLEVDIGSGNGLVLLGNKPLLETMLTKIYVTILNN